LSLTRVAWSEVTWPEHTDLFRRASILSLSIFWRGGATTAIVADAAAAVLCGQVDWIGLEVAGEFVGVGFAKAFAHCSVLRVMSSAACLWRLNILTPLRVGPAGSAGPACVELLDAELLEHAASPSRKQTSCMHGVTVRRPQMVDGPKGRSRDTLGLGLVLDSRMT